MHQRDDVKQRVDMHRKAAWRTLDEVKQRLSPDAVAQEVLSRVDRHLALRTIRDTVRRRPFPFAVLAAFAVWLMKTEAGASQPLHRPPAKTRHARGRAASRGRTTNTKTGVRNAEHNLKRNNTQDQDSHRP